MPCPVAEAWRASGFPIAINAVCSGGMVKPKRANRLGRTAMLFRASPVQLATEAEGIGTTKPEGPSLQPGLYLTLAPLIPDLRQEDIGQHG